MSIKIIGGLAKGFSLKVPREQVTRPTSILLRRKLFDWRQNLESFTFCDLFAGSGAVGLEAFSRGADYLLMNEVAKEAYGILKINYKKFLVFYSKQANISIQIIEDKMTLSKLDGFKALKKIFQSSNQENIQSEKIIIFLDPPYQNHEIYLQCLHFLKQEKFRGELWVESDRVKGLREDHLKIFFEENYKFLKHSDHFIIAGKLKV